MKRMPPMKYEIEEREDYAELLAAAKGMITFIECGLATANSTEDEWYQAATRLLRAIAECE